MSNLTPQRQRTEVWIYFLVGSLCCAFCFCYLWKVQGGMLAMAQHILSRGQTVYYPAVDALLLTIVFQVLQWVLNMATRLRGEWFALSYFPPFVMLSVLTSLDATVYTGHGVGAWSWGFPLVAAAYIGLVIFLRGKVMFRSHRGAGLQLKLLIPNILIALIMMLLTCTWSDNDKRLHHQFDMELAISNSDYQKALLVGRSDMRVNPSISALRAYALARCGQLGERLFDFPQPYGSDGLLISRADSLRTLYHLDSIYYHLGAYPSAETTTTMKFLHYLDLSERQRKPMAKDYLLAALLLDKKLPEFVNQVEKMRNDSVELVLPRHYQEALVLYRHRFKPDFWYENEEQEKHYNAYQSDMRKGIDDREESSLSGEYFGNTYWWYYDFSTANKE